MEAEDLLEKASKILYDDAPYSVDSAINVNDVKKLMIEFAKFHVEKALKAASEESLLRFDSHRGYWTDTHYNIDDYTNVGPDKNSILNAYPLENIK